MTDFSFAEERIVNAADAITIRFMELSENLERMNQAALGVVPCKGILLNEATDDWSGCAHGVGDHSKPDDCPTCHGTGYMKPILN